MQFSSSKATASGAAFIEHEGVFPHGTPWRMRRPAAWNGILINDLDFAGRPDNPQNTHFIDAGYAVVGTSRHPRRNFIYDPERETLDLVSTVEMFVERLGKPRRTIQYGTSGGGFVALNMAERYANVIDGAVAGCAHEQVPLLNMMLDGWFVLQTLLAPDLQITDFSSLEQVDEASQRWIELLTRERETAAGRARMALAAAIGQWPVWSSPILPRPDPADGAAVQAAVLDTVLLNAAQPGGQSRFMAEHAGGSDQPRQLSWNKGIDYDRSLANAEPVLARLVEALYATGAADLHADLAKLRGAARIEADPQALGFWGAPGHTVQGTPQVPLLRMHGTGDNIVPPAIVGSYEQKIRQNGGYAQLYRTVIVDCSGHIQVYNPSEAAAAVKTVLERVDTGSWPDTAPGAMNERARTCIPGSAPRFVEHAPVRSNRPENAP